MLYRSLGATGLQVSTLGVGTWAWGGMWGPRDDRAAIATLHAAVERGINFVDTALIYGDGHSEGVIRRGLQTVRQRVYVATKIPPKNYEWPARATTPLAKAYPSAWITRCTERSLKALGVECLDLQQFHVWTDAWLEQPEWLEAVRRLKRDGKIRHFGVSVNDHEPDSVMALVRSGLVETIQVIYNLFDQTPAERLLPLCQERGVGVIVRVPFDEGGLTGTLTPQTRFHRDDWRGRYFAGDKLRETVERAAALTRVLVPSAGPTLAHAALRFCISHPAVSTVIPGMRHVEHLADNLAAVEQLPLESPVLAQLKEHAWPRNFYAGVW